MKVSTYFLVFNGLSNKDVAGSWFQNRRFRQRKVGGAIVVRLVDTFSGKSTTHNHAFMFLFDQDPARRTKTKLGKKKSETTLHEPSLRCSTLSRLIWRCWFLTKIFPQLMSYFFHKNTNKIHPQPTSLIAEGRRFRCWHAQKKPDKKNAQNNK